MAEIELSETQKIAQIETRLDVIETGVSSGALVPYESWAVLSAVTVIEGDGALVIEADTGTHHDPVTDWGGGGTPVLNAGVYRGVVGAHTGWKRIDDSDAVDARGYRDEAAAVLEDPGFVIVANDLQDPASMIAAVAGGVIDLDTIASAAVQTASDRIATAADVALTHADVTAANLSAQQAAASAIANNTFLTAHAAALPRGLSSVTIGGTAITGATPGTYALTPVGGSVTGIAANLVVDTATTAHIVITNPGLNLTGGTTVPTFANPAGATLPGGTTLTAVLAPLIPTSGAYWAPTSDSLYLARWSNDGTATPAAVLNPDASQVKMPTKGVTDALSAFLVTLAPETGYAFGIGAWDVDGFTFRASILIDLAGATSFVGSVSLPAATVTTANLDAATQSLLMVPLAPETGYTFAIGGYDADGFTFRASYLIALDGTALASLDARSALAINRPLITAAGGNYAIMQIPTGNGTYRIDSLSRAAAGKRITLTSSGRNPILTPDDFVLFDDPSQTGNTPTQRYVSAAGGTVRAAVPGLRLREIGDSQFLPVNAPSAPYRDVDIYTGWTLLTGNNALSGIGTQRSDMIAARYGLPVAITLPGNSLPTSSSVEPSAMLITGGQSDRNASDRVLRTSAGSGPQTCGPLAYTTSTSLAVTLWLASGGVPCLLATNASGVYGLSQVGGTGTLTVPPNTTFTVDQGVANEYIASFEGGRNNPLEPIQVRADHAFMRGSVASFVKHVIGIGVTTKSDGTEPAGSAVHNGMLQINTWLAADYGGDGFGFIDMHKMLLGIAPYNGTGTSIVVNADGSRTLPSWAARMGITLSGPDITAIGLDQTPPSATSDGLHWVASAVAARRLTQREIINLNGWSTAP